MDKSKLISLQILHFLHGWNLYMHYYKEYILNLDLVLLMFLQLLLNYY